jgi:hypothetical protein
LERRRGKKDIGVVVRRQSKEGRRVETRRRRGDKERKAGEESGEGKGEGMQCLPLNQNSNIAAENV